MKLTTEDDIALVKDWCKASHIDDPDALDSFNGVRGVFDVSLSGEQLDGFIKKHSLNGKANRGNINALVGHREVYFAFKMPSTHEPKLGSGPS